MKFHYLLITCVLIHCFTGGFQCPEWCGLEVPPSLPGSSMPVLRILTVDGKFGRGYSDARNSRTYQNKWTLDNNYPKTNYRTSVIHAIYCIKWKNTWLLDCVNGDVYFFINFNLCWLAAIPAWIRDSNHYSNQNKNVFPSLMHWSNVSFAFSEQHNVVSRPQRVNIVVGSLVLNELI